MRGSNSGYAHGTTGSPQATLEQEEYAIKVAENEAKLKAEADNAPLIDPLHIAEMEAKGVKFSRENVMLTARDATGQVIWLESGNKLAGYEHMQYRNHVAELAKYFGVDEAEVPRLIRNVIRDGRIFSNKLKQVAGREGYERIYEYNGKKVMLASIGLNGFVVTAYPRKDLEK